MSKDWSHVGPVTVRVFNGKVRTFDCLDEAVRWVGPHYLKSLKGGRLGSVWSKFPWGREECILGDTHTFFDELGMRIPVWRVQEAYENLPTVYRSWVRRHKFREGPVQGIRHYSWHRQKNKRHIGKMRAEAALMGEEYFVTSKPAKVLDPWDDDRGRSCRGIKSWKRHRRNQHREIS